MRPKTSSFNLPTLITRALLSAQNTTPRTWTPNLEHTLHKLNIRDSLTPNTVSQVIDLLPHHTLALGFFNWASQQPKFTHNPLTYHSILKTLSQSRQFNTVESVLKQCKKTEKLKLSSSTYEFVLTALVRNGRTRNAFLVYREVEAGVGFSGGVLNLLLAGLAGDGFLQDARRVFDDIVLRNVGFSTIGFGVFLFRWCRDRGLEGVLSMVELVSGSGVGVNGSIVVVLVVDGLCKGLRVDEAFWVLDEFRSRGFKPDFIAYRVVAEGFREMGNLVDMEMVLKKKRKLGVAPRADDYKRFVLELVSEGRVREAKELAEVIVSGNFPIEDDVLNVLIGLVSDFDIDSALGFFNFLVGKGRFPTVMTLSNLSNNLCKHGMAQELLEVYQILSSNGYFSDEESYSMRIRFLCKAGRIRDAYVALQEMKKDGFGPNVSLYNTLLDACCKEDLLRPAKRLWDEMFASRCPANLETYNILICKFLEVGQVEDSQRLFHHMLDKGLKPDATTYISLLGGLCQVPKLDDAIEVFNKSVEQDAMLANNILSTFIANLCKNGHSVSACKLLRGLSTETGNSDSHVVLLKYLADTRELPMAIEHINYVHKTYPPLLQDIYAELLALISSSTEQDQMLQMLNEIQETLELSDTQAWNNSDSHSFNYG